MGAPRKCSPWSAMSLRCAGAAFPRRTVWEATRRCVATHSRLGIRADAGRPAELLATSGALQRRLTARAAQVSVSRRCLAVPAGMEAALLASLVPRRVHDVVNPRLAARADEELCWVSDAGQAMDKEARKAADALCQELNAEWRAEVVVVLLDALPEDVRPAAFSAALLNYWGVGDPKLHTGLLALLLLKQRRVEVRVGFGAGRVFKADLLKRLQEERMVPHLKDGAIGPALEGLVGGMREALDKDGPKHWRRATDRGLDSPNKHGFGGGQTPIDEFMPRRPGHGGSAAGGAVGGPLGGRGASM